MEQSSNNVHQIDNQANISPPTEYIPPPRNLLPRPKNVANSLLPMLPLPQFTGNIPEHEPYVQSIKRTHIESTVQPRSWIADAFDNNIVYQKYPSYSYDRMESSDMNWNVWACDISKLQGEKPDKKYTEQDILPFYQIIDNTDRTLIFESRFESGNLSMVSKVSDQEYNLLLQNDINTIGYTQWFFFRVSNTTQSLSVKFNILNLYKASSLFGSGMKVVVYSIKESQKHGKGWHRDGNNISYSSNNYSKSYKLNNQCYTFSWTYKFKHAEDEVYFAYSYPYTYSDLDQYLETVCTNKKIAKRTLLTKTLVGNRVDLLTITQQHPDPGFDKGFIVIGARVHPGETVSSYIVKGFINFLMGDSLIARKLRQTFIFKIVPMTNPDGVIHGNYRTNISGSDLNRKWADCTVWKHQQIYSFRKMILKCEEQSKVHLFCDIHGHSIKKSAFVYGNHNSSKPFEGKEFPYILGKLSNAFLFKNCSFLSSQVREGSGRSALSKQLSSPNVYTLQSSFCGPENQSVHFTVKHFQELGKNFCEALELYFQPYIKEHYIDAARKGNYNLEPEIQKTNGSERQSICQQLYKNRSCLVERINSENSQGSQEQIQVANIITEAAVKRFLKKSTGKYYPQKRLKSSSNNKVAKSTVQFLVNKSSPKKSSKLQLKNNEKSLRMQVLPTDMVVKSDRPAIRQKFPMAAKPIKKDSLKNLTTPGKIVTLQFNSGIGENLNTHKNNEMNNVDKSKVHYHSQSKYEFLTGMDTNQINNYCFNNFVTSIPRRPIAKRSISEIDNSQKSANTSRVNGINEFARKTYYQRLDANLSPSPPKNIKQLNGEYNIFKNVLESLRKR